MLWTPSQIFLHSSQSLVMISNQSGWQRILESKVQKKNFFKITEHKGKSFSFQWRCAQLVLKKEACGLHSPGLENYLQCGFCHRGRHIWNRSQFLPFSSSRFLSRLLPCGKPSCWEKNLRCLCCLGAVAFVFSGLLSLCGSLSYWNDIPPPLLLLMSSVISASVAAAAASGWKVSVFAFKMSFPHLSQYSDSLISSFPAAFKCIQNKWCTKDSLNTAKQL